MKIIFPLFFIFLSLNLFSQVSDERFTVSKNNFTVSEDGTTDSFSLSLAKAPTDDVVISFIDETNEAIVNGTFTFTPGDWDQPQTVTVEGVTDNIIDGDQDFNLSIISDSNDEDFVLQRKQIVAGGYHTCALLENGTVRCWGNNSYGQLGYGNTDDIGDDEAPLSAGAVDVGGTVKQIAAGLVHTCVLLESGSVRCWGNNNFGQLGYGNHNWIGDDESPSSAGDVDVGGSVKQIATGKYHTCALLESGTVRCWGGNNFFGQLGYANTDDIGDDESPSSAGDVDVGGSVKQIVAGGKHTCALLESGAVRCWGYNGLGELGYGNTDWIGDDETPASVGFVDVGGTVKQIAVGGEHTCALLESGAIRCWGDGSFGQLGYANTDIIGDNETPASVGDIEVGGTVKQITAGTDHTCALLESGTIRCWGKGAEGQLGYGNTDNIGDDELPSSAGNADVDGTVKQIVAGSSHTCVLLESGSVGCWGDNIYGQLGYGNTNNIGDNELPSSVGDVSFKDISIYENLVFSGKNLDVDSADILVTSSESKTSEDGDSINVDVVLNSKPTNTVTINIESSDESEGAVSTSSITFTSENWNVAQTISVTGVRDDTVDEDQEFSISFSVESSDSKYDELAIDEIELTNENIDEETTSIKLVDRVKVLPSIANGALMIKTELDNYSVFVTDFKGRMIYRKNNISGHHKIELGSSARGRYFVMIRKDGLKLNKAIIIK